MDAALISNKRTGTDDYDGHDGRSNRKICFTGLLCYFDPMK